MSSTLNTGITSNYVAGCYGWWSNNYANDPEYKKVLGVLLNCGYDISTTEIDHFPPVSAYTAIPHVNINDARKPAFPLIKCLHQPTSGEGNMGGHATSSKSSAVAKAWQKEEKQLISGQSTSSSSLNTSQQTGYTMGAFAQAMLQDIYDKQNLGYHALVGKLGHGQPSFHLFDRLLMPGINYAANIGLITEQDAIAIYTNMVFRS